VLKNARLRSISLRQSLTDNNIDPALAQDEFGVGELLVLSGAISESQLMTAKELESVERQANRAGNYRVALCHRTLCAGHHPHTEND
jgi:hypothetical protein